MDENLNRLQHLSNDLTATVNRFMLEYDTNYAEIVGVMQIVMSKLVNESFEYSEPDPEFEEGD